jgi:hypothetical protein
MVVVLAAAVALVFTPCCELFAAIEEGASGPADVHSTPAPDSHAPTHDHAPASESWCGTALDEIVSPLADLAPPAPNANAMAWSVPHSFPLPLALSPAAHRLATRSGTVGPPLYLRFAHLLI